MDVKLGGKITLLICFLYKKHVRTRLYWTLEQAIDTSAEGCCKGTGHEIEFKYFD